MPKLANITVLYLVLLAAPRTAAECKLDHDKPVACLNAGDPAPYNGALVPREVIDRALAKPAPPPVLAYAVVFLVGMASGIYVTLKVVP